MVKKPPANRGDMTDVSLIPGSGRFTGGEEGNPLQYSGLEYPMDRGASWATVPEFTESQTQLKRISTQTMQQISYVDLVSNMFERKKAEAVTHLDRHTQVLLCYPHYL